MSHAVNPPPPPAPQDVTTLDAAASNAEPEVQPVIVVHPDPPAQSKSQNAPAAPGSPPPAPSENAQSVATRPSGAQPTGTAGGSRPPKKAQQLADRFVLLDFQDTNGRGRWTYMGGEVSRTRQGYALQVEHDGGILSVPAHIVAKTDKLDREAKQLKGADGCQVPGLGNLIETKVFEDVEGDSVDAVVMQFEHGYVAFDKQAGTLLRSGVFADANRFVNPYRTN